MLKTLFRNGNIKIFFILGLCGCVGIFLLILKLNDNKNLDVKEIIDFVDTNKIKDSTTQHISNMNERYQVLPDRILYLSGKRNRGSRLCQTDRKGNNFKELADDVTSFLEYEDNLYYITQSDNALCRYDLDTDKKEYLLEKGVDWFTVYEENLLIIGDESIKTYNLKNKTTKTVFNHLSFSYPFCAERIGNYIILCDNNVRLISLKDKKVLALLERGALSFDEIAVYENKAYIRMQKYSINNYDDIVTEDESWNGIWHLDMEVFEKSRGNTGFEKLSKEQLKKLLASGKIPENAGVAQRNEAVMGGGILGD